MDTLLRYDTRRLTLFLVLEFLHCVIQAYLLSRHRADFG
jgi:hypothetical protein